MWIYFTFFSFSLGLLIWKSFSEDSEDKLLEIQESDSLRIHEEDILRMDREDILIEITEEDRLKCKDLRLKFDEDEEESFDNY